MTIKTIHLKYYEEDFDELKTWKDKEGKVWENFIFEVLAEKYRGKNDD